MATAVVNPVPGASYARTDQGVDYVGSGNILAAASGVILDITDFAVYEIFDAPLCVPGTNRCYREGYYAETSALVQKGAHVDAGAAVATGSSGGYEVGFVPLGQTHLGSPPGGLGATTMLTQEGIDFNTLVCALGGPCASQSQIRAEIASRGFAGGNPITSVPPTVVPSNPGVGGGTSANAGNCTADASKCSATSGIVWTPVCPNGKCPPGSKGPPVPGLGCQVDCSYPGAGGLGALNPLSWIGLNTRQILLMLLGVILFILGIYLLGKEANIVPSIP